MNRNAIIKKKKGNERKKRKKLPAFNSPESLTICIDCGEEYSNLTQHLMDVHRINLDEYVRLLEQGARLDLSAKQLSVSLRAITKAKKEKRYGVVGQSPAIEQEGSHKKIEKGSPRKKLNIRDASNDYKVHLDYLSQKFNSEQVRASLNSIEKNEKILKKLTNSKWQELVEADRRFGLSETVEHVIPIEMEFLRRIGVSTLILEGIVHGNLSILVTLVFETGNRYKMKLVNGRMTEIPTVFSDAVPKSGVTLFTLVVLFYYIDMCVSNEVIPSKSRDTGSKLRISNSNIENSKKPTNIPRRSSISKPSVSTFRENRSNAAEVAPFRRRLPAGSSPSLQKIIDADRYGITLDGPDYPKVKYTWVKPHQRGEHQPAAFYQYRDYNAVAALNTILDSL